MSFEIELDPHEEAGGRLVAEFGSQLQDLFVYRRENEKVTQQVIAEKLGVDRSRVNRCLSGFSNLTISTLGEVAHAMDGVVIHCIVPKEQLSQWKIVRVSSGNSQSRTIFGYFGERPHIRNLSDPNPDEEFQVTNMDTTSVPKTQVVRNLRWTAS